MKFAVTATCSNVAAAVAAPVSASSTAVVISKRFIVLGPHGYASSGSFCVPAQGAQDAIAEPANAT